MKYQKYSVYKESGVEWLGDVPEHWDSVPIKYMALEKCSLFLDGDWIESKDLSDEGIRYITTGNIGEGIYKEQGAGYITEDKFQKLNCTEVFEGDILISRLNMPIGRSCIVPNLESRIITSVDNVIFRPDSQYSKNYLVYLFSSEDYFKHTGDVARGTTMQRISRGLLGNIRVVVPPLLEQQKIANFLDHETAKIDTLIEKQRRLIELLKEKRQAVISHAVTKGLNPNAPMKNSGVEWLGEVPEHWAVKPIKHLAELNPKKSEITLSKNLTCNFVPMEKLKTGTVLLDEVKAITDVYDGYTYFRNDDILMAKVTPCFENHNIAIVKELENNIGFGSTEIYVLRAKTNIVNEFVFYRLQESNFMAVAVSAMTGAGGLKRVPAEVVNNYLLAIPDFEEQEKIANYIDGQTIKIDNLIEKSEIAINLMQERRTALISAAVTGKIDVRNWR